jgi:glycosyltransferase involved in cell wall biosynthesis
MRVLHAAKFYPPVEGGMETVVGDLCAGTAQDWDVRVVAANTTPWTERDTRAGVRIVRAGSLGQAASVPLCPSFPFHVWSTPADCVVLHEPNPVAGSTLFLHTPARHLVVWHHSDLLRPWWAPATYGRIQRALYRRADCVVVSSPPLAEHSTLVACARRVAVIPFGIDLPRYQRDDPDRRARVAAIRARVPGPRLLFVGRLVYYKGVDLLIDAMARCRGTLMVVGEGPLEAHLRSGAMRRGLGDRVVFEGRVGDDDLPAYYQAADLFVLPSVAKTEAFGVVQAEAMAAGLPVVSTNLPTGVPWVNRDGVSGLVVPPGDAHALGRALGRLVEDAALRRRLGEGARRRAEALFSRPRMVRAFKELIETIVARPDALDSHVERMREEVA